MDDPLKSIQRQTQRYWYVDGLNELGAGVLIFSLGLLYLGMGIIGPSDASDWLLGVGQPVLLVVGWLVVNWWVKRFKERITYPRTGYIAYLRPRGSRLWAKIFLTALIAAGFAVGATLAGHLVGEALLPALLGLMLAGAMAYLGYEFNLRRFYGVAIYTLALGGLCAWLSLPDKFTMALFFCGFGLGWGCSGAWALRSYLLNTLPAAEEEV